MSTSLRAEETLNWRPLLGLPHFTNKVDGQDELILYRVLTSQRHISTGHQSSQCQPAYPETFLRSLPSLYSIGYRGHRAGVNDIPPPHIPLGNRGHRAGDWCSLIPWSSTAADQLFYLHTCLLRFQQLSKQSSDCGNTSCSPHFTIIMWTGYFLSIL